MTLVASGRRARFAPTRLIRHLGSYCLCAFALALATWIAAPSAYAADAPVEPDPGPPPVTAGIGQAGYDLMFGTFTWNTTEVTIGDPSAGGLAYSRTIFGAGWRDNYTGTINVTGSTYTVSLGSNSETFTYAAGPPETFTSVQGRGSTLERTLNSGVYTYTYTLRDGTEAVFDGALANGGSIYDANVARVSTVTAPNGEVTTWHYKSVTVQSVAALRLQAVTNNLGYQLHFEYKNNNPTLSSQLEDWKTLAKVVGINMGVEYCDPTANTCSVASSWPYATYDVSGAFSTVTDNLGQVTKYSAGDNGLVYIRRPTSPSANNIAIGYGAGGRVASVTNSVGTWQYTYSDAGSVRTTTVYDPLMHTRVVVSNLVSQTITSDTNGTSNTTSYQYDSSRRLTRVTMPEGNYTVYQYDARGNITQTTVHNKADNDTIVTSAAFDSSCTNPLTCNQPNSTTDARGYRTDYTYDSTHGGVLTVTQPAPDGSTPVGSGTRPQARYAYDDFYAYYKNSGGSIVQGPSSIYRLIETSACATSASCDGTADETVVTLGYGPQTSGTANNLLPVTSTAAAGDNSVSSTTTTTYDAVGNTESVDGPLSGDTTTFFYDAVRRLTGVIGPDSGSSVYRAIRNTYNADGQVTRVERGTTTSSSSMGSFSALWHKDNEYNFIGQLIRETVINGSTTVAVTQYSYDTPGRLECTAQRNNPSTFASLPSSACTGVLVASGVGADRITRATYNNAGRQTMLTRGADSYAPINEWTVTYTANGQVDTLTDAGGNLTTYVYDGFDRNSRIRFPNTSGGGSSTTDYEEMTYDDNGNVTQLRRRDATTLDNTYDNLNRIVEMDASTNSADIASSYDLLGRLLSQGDGSETLEFTYDALSRNLSQESALGTITYQYDAAGRRTRMDYPGASPNDLYITYDWSVYGEVTAIREKGATSGAGVLATYTYDTLGRPSAVTRGNGTTATLTYDTSFNLNVLAQNLNGSGNDETITLTHSAVGQITSRLSSDVDFQWSPIAPGTTNYTDNGLNQYTGAASYTYTDGRGNMTSDGTNTYAYDIYNHMITAPSSTTLSYDPVGRLSQVSSGSATTRTLYDGANAVADYNGSNALQRRYVFGLEGPIVWYEGTNTNDRRWLISDERGSIIATTDVSGDAISINTYDEYGRNGGSNGGRFQYVAAQWIAEASVYHMGARDYSPSIGRWLQTDPILQSGGINIYAYVDDDPTNKVDPSGLDEWTCTPNGSGGWDCPGGTSYGGCPENNICTPNDIAAYLDQLARDTLNNIGTQLQELGDHALLSLREDVLRCGVVQVGVTGTFVRNGTGTTGTRGVYFNNANGRVGTFATTGATRSSGRGTNGGGGVEFAYSQTPGAFTGYSIEGGVAAGGVATGARYAPTARQGRGGSGAWSSFFVVGLPGWWDPLESTCRHASLSIL